MEVRVDVDEMGDSQAAVSWVGYADLSCAGDAAHCNLMLLLALCHMKCISSAADPYMLQDVFNVSCIRVCMHAAGWQGPSKHRT